MKIKKLILFHAQLYHGYFKTLQLGSMDISSLVEIVK